MEQPSPNNQKQQYKTTFEHVCAIYLIERVGNTLAMEYHQKPMKKKKKWVKQWSEKGIKKGKDIGKAIIMNYFIFYWKGEITPDQTSPIQYEQPLTPSPYFAHHAYLKPFFPFLFYLLVTMISDLN